MAKPDNTQMNFSSNVQSQANAGTAGGTMYYINLGGIKMLWMQTASQSVAASGSPNFTITFPTSFFSTIQSITATTQGSAAFFTYVLPSFTSVSSTGATIYFQNTSSSATSAAPYITVIGT